MDQKRSSQQLWAANKYLVLSKSSSIYLEIRNYLKSEKVEVTQVQALIEQAKQLPENRGQVSNAFQHVWGYFKKQATTREKEDFMYLLLEYQSGKVTQEKLVGSVRDLLERYPNRYLEQSTLIFGGDA